MKHHTPDPETYSPPYEVSETAATALAWICEDVGRRGALQERQDLRLRRVNRIRTIQGSLAIEGNTLTETQISAVLEGKPVLAPPREVQEVRNALKVYDEMHSLNPLSEVDLLRAHGILMAGLLDEPGRYRRTASGVMGKEGLVHVAPPADRVPFQVRQLLSWLKTTSAHPLLAGAVFHYEFEFIHPFADGNGRMGRLWQSLILQRWNGLFADLPVESLIHARQADYYRALNQSTLQSSCTPFIEFILLAIQDALKASPQETTWITTPIATRKTPDARILSLLRQNPHASRKHLAELLGDISEDGIKYHFKKLQANGKLTRIGPPRGGTWQVQDP
jgi:Fic family protein